jgi:hypothetical protein
LPWLIKAPDGNQATGQAGIAYVGREPEYQQYKNLCIQQRIAQDYYMAASMDRYYAGRWYGAWGPRSVWW